MNKKLPSKDEKKVGGWEKRFDEGMARDPIQCYTWEEVKFFIKTSIIPSVEAQSRKEGYEQGVLNTEAELRKKQEEQNRVVNSGRKLFQEGQKAERERNIGEVEKMRKNHQDIFYGKGEVEYGFERTYNHALDDILHILKGDHD